LLEKREKGKYRGETFYCYSRPQNLDEYDNPKVLMRNFSYRSQVTLDTEGRYYFTTNIYGINFKNQDKNFLYFMLALLNSNVTWFYVKSTSAGLRGGYYQYKTKYLKPLPVVDYKAALSKDRETVKAIIKNTKMILKNGDSSRDLQVENDRLFYGLYGLDKADIKNIEKATNYQEFVNSSEDIDAEVA
jgi:hypothetical protein